MPTLDVTDVLFDPDFCDFNLWVTRRVQTVDDDGIGSDSEVKTQFAGVVTVDRSLENRRMQSGQVISGAILIVTTERLTQGQTGRDADIVTYQGRDYRVTFVDPYTVLNRWWKHQSSFSEIKLWHRACLYQTLLMLM